MARWMIFMMMATIAGPASAEPSATADLYRCLSCGDAAARPSRHALRSSVAHMNFADRRRGLAVSYDNGLSLNVERLRKEPRDPLRPERKRSSQASMAFAYGVSASPQDQLSIGLDARVERRRFTDTTRDRWGYRQAIGVAAGWMHDEEWRLSSHYLIQSSRAGGHGLDRSIALATGATPSGSQVALAVDYRPAAIDLPMRIGVEARNDHYRQTDRDALAMSGADAASLRLKLDWSF